MMSQPDHQNKKCECRNGSIEYKKGGFTWGIPSERTIPNQQMFQAAV